MAGSGDPGQAVTPNVTLNDVVFSNDAAKGGAGHGGVTCGGGGGLGGNGGGGFGGSASAVAAVHWDGRFGGEHTGKHRPARNCARGCRRRHVASAAAARAPSGAAAAAALAAPSGGRDGGTGGFGGGGGGGERPRRRTAASAAAAATAPLAPAATAALAAAAATAENGSGNGGFGGGDARTSGGNPTTSGAGGLGAGGDIFVQQGATLTIEGGSLSGGSVAGGAAADEAENGDALGTGIFLQGNQTITFGGAAAQTTLVAAVITDQDGNPTAENFTAGSGGVVIDTARGGTVEFTGANTYTGGTLVEAGRLLLASGGAAGTGGITVQSGAHVVAGSGGSASDITLDSGGRLNVLAGGTVSGLTIDDPDDRSFTARATVASGGTLEGTTNLMGGELLLHQSAVVPTGMDLILQSTARLLLDETGHGFEGVIRDFGPSDTLDLAHVAFAGSGRNATTVHWDQTGGDRGTLTVAHGSQAIDLHLAGHYTTSDFGIRSDGAHGTMVHFV